MRKQLAVFVLRWAVTSVGIWLAINLLNGVMPGSEPTLWTYVTAGLLFSIINSLVKPIIVILSLPVILLTLGLFMLVVNGVLVYLALLFIPSLELSFMEAILAGIILSFMNYVITALLDFRSQKQSSRVV